MKVHKAHKIISIDSCWKQTCALEVDTSDSARFLLQCSCGVMALRDSGFCHSIDLHVTFCLFCFCLNCHVNKTCHLNPNRHCLLLKVFYFKIAICFKCIVNEFVMKCLVCYWVPAAIANVYSPAQSPSSSLMPSYCIIWFLYICGPMRFDMVQRCECTVSPRGLGPGCVLLLFVFEYILPRTVALWNEAKSHLLKIFVGW